MHYRLCGLSLSLYLYTRIFGPRFARRRFYRLTLRPRFFHFRNYWWFQVENKVLRAFRLGICTEFQRGFLVIVVWPGEASFLNVTWNRGNASKTCFGHVWLFQDALFFKSSRQQRRAWARPIGPGPLGPAQLGPLGLLGPFGPIWFCIGFCISFCIDFCISVCISCCMRCCIVFVHVLSLFVALCLLHWLLHWLFFAGLYKKNIFALVRTSPLYSCFVHGRPMRFGLNKYTNK